jgi:hypothetical protein
MGVRKRPWQQLAAAATVLAVSSGLGRVQGQQETSGGDTPTYVFNTNLVYSMCVEGPGLTQAQASAGVVAGFGLPDDTRVSPPLGQVELAPEITNCNKIGFAGQQWDVVVFNEATRTLTAADVAATQVGQVQGAGDPDSEFQNAVARAVVIEEGGKYTSMTYTALGFSVLFPSDQPLITQGVGTVSQEQYWPWWTWLVYGMFIALCMLPLCLVFRCCRRSPEEEEGTMWWGTTKKEKQSPLPEDAQPNDSMRWRGDSMADELNAIIAEIGDDDVVSPSDDDGAGGDRLEYRGPAEEVDVFAGMRPSPILAPRSEISVSQQETEEESMGGAEEEEDPESDAARRAAQLLALSELERQRKGHTEVNRTSELDKILRRRRAQSDGEELRAAASEALGKDAEPVNPFAAAATAVGLGWMFQQGQQQEERGITEPAAAAVVAVTPQRQERKGSAVSLAELLSDADASGVTMDQLEAGEQGFKSPASLGPTVTPDLRTLSLADVLARVDGAESERHGANASVSELVGIVDVAGGDTTAQPEPTTPYISQAIARTNALRDAEREEAKREMATRMRAAPATTRTLAQALAEIDRQRDGAEVASSGTRDSLTTIFRRRAGMGTSPSPPSQQQMSEDEINALVDRMLQE